MNGLTPDLPPRAELAAIANDLRPRLARITSEMLIIAQGLFRAKRLLPHGEFIDWARQQVGVEPRTAERMLRVARRFEGRTDTVSHLPIGALNELAAPSTPDEVVEKVLAGELEPNAAVIRQTRRVVARGQSAARIVLSALQKLGDLYKTEDPFGSLANAILTYSDPENVTDALVTLIAKATDIVQAAVGDGGR